MANSNFNKYIGRYEEPHIELPKPEKNNDNGDDPSNNDSTPRAKKIITIIFAILSLVVTLVTFTLTIMFGSGLFTVIALICILSLLITTGILFGTSHVRKSTLMALTLVFVPFFMTLTFLSSMLGFNGYALDLDGLYVQSVDTLKIGLTTFKDKVAFKISGDYVYYTSSYHGGSDWEQQVRYYQDSGSDFYFTVQIEGGQKKTFDLHLVNFGHDVAKDRFGFDVVFEKVS